MRAPASSAALIVAIAWTAALGVAGASAQTIGPVDPGSQMDVSSPKSVTINGTGASVRSTPGASQGYMVPDAAGGYVDYAPGPPLPPPSPARADAEEVRLYARELAAQVTRGTSGDMPLTGVVSVPSAFVDQDTRTTSSFGRLMGEQMIYELNSRGFPVKEARGGAPLRAAKGRRGSPEAVAVLAGSYYVDKDNLFVNARLVEPSGRVLRSGSVLIPMTPTLRRMLGLPEPNPYGWRPTPPTLIGARDVNDAPCVGAGCGERTAAPYVPAPKAKRAPARKYARHRARPKNPCPPGSEQAGAQAKGAGKKARSNPQAQPEPAPASQQPAPLPAQPGTPPSPAPVQAPVPAPPAPGK